MPRLRYETRVPLPPAELGDRLCECAHVRTILPTLLARGTLPATGRLTAGCRVEFRPRVFPERWRVVSHLDDLTGGRFVWRWLRGPMRGTETWHLCSDGSGGTRFETLVEYEAPSLRERAWWALVGRPAHHAAAWFRHRGLRRLSAPRRRA